MRNLISKFTLNITYWYLYTGWTMQIEQAVTSISLKIKKFEKDKEKF